MRNIVFILLVACSKKDAPAPAVVEKNPTLPVAELQRATDACSAYVTKVCACTSDGAKKACPLAQALPDAIKLALETANNPATDRDNASRALVNVRETAKECIESAAKLPALGCP